MTTRLSPDTTEIDLEFNAGEDMEIELVVTDRDGTPVPLAGAVGTIAVPFCQPEHTWTVAGGNLELADADGVVRLTCTRDETAAWASGFGDAQWQLDVTDIFGRGRRVCEGDVRVNPTLQGEAA